MGLYNNVPTFTYVSADGITVTYNEEIYTVQSFYTNKKYIYWDYDNATVLQASNTMPTRSFKTHLVLINDNGIAKTVPSTYEGFEISYTGDGNESVKAKIYALQQKDKELGDKYVAIEQDVAGIKQIVGSSGTLDLGGLIDRISKIEQTAENIELKVEENQITYNEDKEATKLREDLNSAIINLNTSISTFNSEISNYYKDNVISNEEKISIETMLELITYSKSEVLVYADKIRLIAEDSNDTSGAISLNSAITALDNVHVNLINNTTAAIGDGIITPTEKTVIINAIAQYNLRINEFKNTCDDIIFLGFGGTVVDKLAQLSVESDEIRLSVSKVESSFTTELSLQKLELEGQIGEVTSTLDTFKNTVQTTFKDGLINEVEKRVLLEKIEQLEKEKLDIDARCLDAYNSKYLISPYKETLKSQHDRFNDKHTQLKNKISEVVNLGNVTENENNQISTLFNEYSVVLSELKVVLDNSLDIISTNKANEEILKAKQELSKEISDINTSLEDVFNNLDNIILDGVVDTSEKKAIESTLTSLEKEKVDVEAQFAYWGLNTYLVEPLKSQYDEVYETYLAKYDNIVLVIEGIINKEGLVNDADRDNLVNAHTDLSNALYDFLNKTNVVIEFVTLKQYEDLISVIENDIEDIHSNLKELDIVLDGTLQDDLLSESEKIVIREQLTILEREKVEIDNNHYSVYDNPFLSDDLKDNLKTEYDLYIESYNCLVSSIENIINTEGLITDDDRVYYDNAITIYKESISTYTLILKQSIDNISSNSIKEAKQVLQEEILDVLASLEDLESNMNDIFRDGVLSDAEKTTIKQQLETLKKEKADVDKQYSTLYNNESLVDTSIAKSKSELRIAYDNFITKYNALVSTINTIISKTTIISDTDRNNLTNALNDYRSASTFYIGKATNAIDSIAQKKADDSSDAVDKKYAEIILGENGIQSIVEHIKGDYASKSLVEQTANSIQSSVEVIRGDYASKSQLTQTENKFEFKISKTGGKNYIRNSQFKHSTKFWDCYQCTLIHVGNCPTWINKFNVGTGLGIKNTSSWKVGTLYTENISVETNNYYSVSLDGYIMSNVKGAELWIEEKREDGSIIYSHFVGNINNEERFGGTIIVTNQEVKYLTVIVKHLGLKAEGAGNDVVYVNNFKLEQGEHITAHSQHSEEIYANNVLIDKDGLTIYNKNGSIVNMGSEEFSFTDDTGNKSLGINGGGLTFHTTNLAEYIGFIKPINLLPNDTRFNGISLSNTEIGDFICIGSYAQVDESATESNTDILIVNRDIEGIGDNVKGVYFYNLPIISKVPAYFNNQVTMQDQTVFNRQLVIRSNEEWLPHVIHTHNEDLALYGHRGVSLGIRDNGNFYKGLRIVFAGDYSNKCYAYIDMDIDFKNQYYIKNAHLLNCTIHNSYSLSSGYDVDIENDIDVLIANEPITEVKKDGTVVYNNDDMIKLLYEKIFNLEKEIKELKNVL